MSISIIGGIFIDVKAWPDHEIKWRDSNAGKISYTAGGVARNIAENIGRLGISCNLFGIVGDDVMGQKVLADTALGGVGVSHILKSKMAATGTSMIQLDEKGDLMCCTTDMGATASISKTYVENVWEYIEGSALIIVDTELKKEVLQLILDKANAEDIPVLIEPVSGEKSRKVAHLTGKLTYFTPNEVEYEAFEQEPSKTIRIHHFLKTCGPDGVWWQGINQSGKQFPVTPIEIVDATGAGDAFVAGFACARYLQKNMETAIAFGHKLAALTLQSPLAVSEAINETLLQDV
jgi:sugar/nucleoside kinase (ribokinase family)